MSKPFPVLRGSRLHGMNPDDAPSTPPEPPKAVRSMTLAMWAVIILAAMVLVALAVVKTHGPQARVLPSADTAVPPSGHFNGCGHTCNHVFSYFP